MRHTFLVVTVKRWLKSVYIYEVIAKLKPGYHFFGPPGRLLFSTTVPMWIINRTHENNTGVQ